MVREVRYPVWWYWCYWWRMPNTASQEIAHGTAATEADGTFTIEFVAKPDISVSEKDEPTFHYSVTADVTDTTGETRSGEQQHQRGLHGPEGHPGRRRLANRPETGRGHHHDADTRRRTPGSGRRAEDLQAQATGEGRRSSFFPQRPTPFPRRGTAVTAVAPPKPDPSNPNSWELGDKAAEEGFNIDKTGTLKKTFKLPAGPYRAVLETQDRFGKQVKALLPIQVLQLDGKVFPIKVANVVAAPKWTIEPGQEFMALWGTGYDKGRAFVEVEHRGKIVQAFWTEFGLTQQTVKQAVTDAHRGGFWLRVTMVREDRGYMTTHKIDVPWKDKDLTVKWEHFTSKLEPGKKETWTAVITGPDAKKTVAEMVATLYDESLDAYARTTGCSASTSSARITPWPTCSSRTA